MEREHATSKDYKLSVDLRHHRPAGFLILTICVLWQFSCASVLSTESSPQDGEASVSSAAPELNTRSLARAIHEEVNRVRRSRSLTTLDWNEPLARIAYAHSEDMASRKYFGHVNRQGQDPTARAAEAGFECSKQEGNRIYSGIAENLYQTAQYSRWRVTVHPNGERIKTYDWKSLNELARETVDAWMESPGHRANLLNHTYGTQGIGVEIAPDQKVYVTENFC